MKTPQIILIALALMLMSGVVSAQVCTPVVTNGSLIGNGTLTAPLGVSTAVQVVQVLTVGTLPLAALLSNAGFWDRPRGLAAVLDDDDKIVEDTARSNRFLKLRRDPQTFPRYASCWWVARLP